MIIYFSGTGNTLAVARRISQENGDELLDLGKAFKEGRLEVELEQGEDLGFVWPVYRWSTPSIVDRFVRNMKLSVKGSDEKYKPGYCYNVVTYGYFPGNETKYFANELEAYQGLEIDSYFTVPTVENCIYVTNPPAKAKADAKNAKFEPAIEKVAKEIAARKMGVKPKRNPAGMLMSLATGTDEKPRATKQFNVIIDKCTGCGTCAKVCPTNTITMVDGYPIWSGTDCTECLACIHLCPAGASQYGKISLKRNRYVNPILKEAK